MELILKCINNNPQLRPSARDIVDELARLVEQHPHNRQAMLMPVLPLANKGKKAKHITDYDYVEVQVVHNSSEEAPQKLTVKTVEEKKDESLSWAGKQIKRAKAFFTLKFPVSLILLKNN